MFLHKLWAIPKSASSFKYYSQFCSQKKTIKPNPSIDYYARLNLKRNASLPEIKKSYFQLSKKYHPDVSLFNQDKLNEVMEAFNVLSNDELRKIYDEMTVDKFEQSQHQYSGPYQTQQQYKSRVQKGFYNQSVLAWHKTRSGINGASYISRESSKIQEIGNDSEETLDFHYRRRQRRQQYFEEQEQIRKSKENPEQMIRKYEQIKREHSQRIHQLKLEVLKQNQRKFEKTMIGKIIKRMKNVFNKEQEEKK